MRPRWTVLALVALFSLAIAPTALGHTPRSPADKWSLTGAIDSQTVQSQQLLPVCQNGQKTGPNDYGIRLCKEMWRGQIVAISGTLAGIGLQFTQPAGMSDATWKSLQENGSMARMCAEAKLLPAPGYPPPDGLTQEQFQDKVRSGEIPSPCEWPQS